MKYRLSDLPLTILVVPFGFICAFIGAFIGGSLLVPYEQYGLTAPVLALALVVVTTINLQVRFPLDKDKGGVDYFKAYLSKMARIAIVVCSVGFFGGWLDTLQFEPNGHSPCFGLDRC